MTKTFETFDMIRELVNNKTVRDQAWVQIKKQAGEYIDATVCLQNSCRYQQGKIAFEVASMFVGIGELKAGLQAAKFTKLLKAVDNISDQIKVIHRAIHGLGGKFVKTTTKGVVDLVSATGTKIAKVTNGLIEPLAQYITTDPSKKVVRRLNGVKYKLPNSTQEVTGDIELVDGGGCEGLRLNAETQVAACNLLWRVASRITPYFATPKQWWDYLNDPVNADLKLHYDRYWSRLMKPYRRVELSTLPDQREISDIIKEFKKSVVCFDAWGFPDFLSFTKNVGNISCKVLIDVTGDFNTDAKRANAELKAKLTGTPFANISTFNGQNNIFGDKITYTWHHDQDSQHMLLVPTMLNTNNKPNLEHLGGSAIIKKGLKNSFPSSVKLNCN